MAELMAPGPYGNKVCVTRAEEGDFDRDCTVLKYYTVAPWMGWRYFARTFCYFARKHVFFPNPSLDKYRHLYGAHAYFTTHYNLASSSLSLVGALP
jgi:hypothetical protein